MYLETQRLTIRPMEAEDAPALARVLGDGEVMRYVEPPFSPEDTERFIQRCGLCRPPRVHALALRSGGLIGHLIWHPLDGPERWELGWILGREYWGRGYAQEASRAILNHALHRGVREIVIECHPDQAATRRLAEKLGFRDAGVRDGLRVFQKALPQGEAEWGRGT